MLRRERGILRHRARFNTCTQHLQILEDVSIIVKFFSNRDADYRSALPPLPVAITGSPARSAAAWQPAAGSATPVSEQEGLAHRSDPRVCAKRRLAAAAGICLMGEFPLSKGLR